MLVKCLSKVSNELGESGDIREFGVSRIIHLPRFGSNFEIGINANHLWINCDIQWAHIPENIEIAFAPDGFSTRAALLSEGVAGFPTGDQLFDSIFLILGDDPAAASFASNLSAHIRRLFSEYADLQPSIQHFEIMTGRNSPMEQRLHVHCTPKVNGNPLHQAQRIAELAIRLKAFVSSIEQVVNESQ
jgi:hypothetical protein